MKSVSFLISKLDASEREGALMMYYYEGFDAGEIATWLALMGYEIERIRTTALGLLQTGVSDWLAQRR